jgi:predicted MFS family arabinose efflux permease
LLASHINWHVPFCVLAGLSLVILGAAARVMPSLRGHLRHTQAEDPASRMRAVLGHRDHQMAFVFMALLTFTGFVVFPNIANYMVLNVGLTEKQLPIIYLAGGAFTVFSMNWIGRWADRAGKLRVFTLMSLSATIPIVAVTNLHHVPLVTAVGVSTLLFICMSGRMVPAMAMMTACIQARYRGGFMSINSSVQQFAAGVAAYVSGHLLGLTPDGRLTHFPIIGAMSVVCAVGCVYLATFLRSPVVGEETAAPLAEPVRPKSLTQRREEAETQRY